MTWLRAVNELSTIWPSPRRTEIAPFEKKTVDKCSPPAKSTNTAFAAWALRCSLRADAVPAFVPALPPLPPKMRSVRMVQTVWQREGGVPKQAKPMTRFLAAKSSHARASGISKRGTSVRPGAWAPNVGWSITSTLQCSVLGCNKSCTRCPRISSIDIQTRSSSPCRMRSERAESRAERTNAATPSPWSSMLDDETVGTSGSGVAARPHNVCVFPAPVWPHATTQLLYPLSMPSQHGMPTSAFTASCGA
mmetsp:Transcript_55240/g.139567  ORF Transcript_55240/g.139567 Transcript_55240/m.139567 type:complete len:249 (-) Transcript_55240:43-789(-)